MRRNQYQVDVTPPKCYSYMITPDGYSKDPGLMAEGIVITLSQKMIEEKCGPGKPGLLKFLRWFEACVNHGTFFMKLASKPTREFDHIYLIVANRLYARCYFGGFSAKPFKGFLRPDAEAPEVTTWKGVFLGGPIEKCPFKRKLSGFRNFRYCTKLF